MISCFPAAKVLFIEHISVTHASLWLLEVAVYHQFTRIKPSDSTFVHFSELHLRGCWSLISDGRNIIIDIAAIK